jgi:hypothetical protein
MAPKRRNSDGILKKTVAVVLSALLIGSASAPAWSATADALTPTDAEVMPATSVVKSSMLGFLKPLVTDTELHQARKSCRSPQLYSQHDVVGDPEACFMGRFTLPGPGFTAGGVSR